MVNGGNVNVDIANVEFQISSRTLPKCSDNSKVWVGNFEYCVCLTLSVVRDFCSQPSYAGHIEAR